MFDILFSVAKIGTQPQIYNSQLQNLSQAVNRLIDALFRRGDRHADVAFAGFAEAHAGCGNDVRLIEKYLGRFHRIIKFFGNFCPDIKSGFGRSDLPADAAQTVD